MRAMESLKPIFKVRAILDMKPNDVVRPFPSSPFDSSNNPPKRINTPEAFEEGGGNVGVGKA